MLRGIQSYIDQNRRDTNFKELNPLWGLKGHVVEISGILFGLICLVPATAAPAPATASGRHAPLVAGSSEHLHLVTYNLGGVALVSFFVFPLAGLNPAFYVDLFAFV